MTQAEHTVDSYFITATVMFSPLSPFPKMKNKKENEKPKLKSHYIPSVCEMIIYFIICTLILCVLLCCLSHSSLFLSNNIIFHLTVLFLQCIP